VLAGPQSGDLYFNLSHSGDAAVLAIAEAGPVGIDIEALRSVDPTLAEAILGPSERSALAALDPSMRSGSLLARWTMKEAALKAVGCGFRQTPTMLDLGLFDNDEPVTVGAEAVGGRGDLVVRNLFDLWPGHVAALAVAPPAGQL
jgi:4'-phosphopantetheinyl transferase